jgi:3-hydroxyacyl-[acyl-carrier-protein] dehydratase
MNDFHHDFDRVEDYLHHRPPYLLVDAIESLDATAVVTRTEIAPDAFYVTGHFPGAPILPGAMMQEMTTQSAGILIAARYNPMESFDTHDPLHNEFALGVLVRVKDARYRGFARPGDVVRIRVELREIVSNMFEFSGRITVGQRAIMRNVFQLTNLKSATLRGDEATD